MAPTKKEPVVPLPQKLAVGGVAGMVGTSIILFVTSDLIARLLLIGDSLLLT